METTLQELEQRMNEHTHNGSDGTRPLPMTAFITCLIAETAAATATNYGVIFTATRPCAVKSVAVTHTATGTSPSLQLERVSTGVVPGSGTDLLVTAFDLTATINVPQYRGVRGGSSLIDRPSLRQGDRLALKISGTLTNLKGVNVTVELTF